MNYTTRQLKSIKWYLEKTGYKLSLSRYPEVYMINKDGSEITRSITGILTEFNAFEKEQKNSRRKS